MSNNFEEYRNSDGTFKPSFYDEQYYENGPQSGRGWLSNYRWLPRRTFREAFAIIDFLNLDENSYVLDVGCAKGFIVRALRELEIPADGCDISSYALSFAPNGCWNCYDPISWHEHAHLGYTNIIIKDMLEHLTVDQLYGMLDNFSIVTNKMFCVVPLGDRGVFRIPEYHTEVSHLIAEDENWWRNAFWKRGWRVIKEAYRINGMKDSWAHIEKGNYVFSLEKYK